MAAGPAAESGGGLLYDQADIYVFLDRVDDQVFWIASTDKVAARCRATFSTTPRANLFSFRTRVFGGSIRCDTMRPQECNFATRWHGHPTPPWRSRRSARPTT